MESESHQPIGQPPARRLDNLEQRFRNLFAQLADSREKEVLSVLHGMMQELWRQLRRTSPPAGAGGPSLEDIVDLYRQAPKMEGERRTTPLPPGTTAPDFALADATGHDVRLADFRDHPVVLVFYPLDWSPGCSQQLDLYQHEIDEFERRGARIAAISVDSIYSHGAWAAVRGIRFPLLADFNPKGDVARRYHVYRTEDGFSDRALYVVDGNGVIRYSHVSPFLHHVPDIYELFAALDGLRSSARETAGVGK